MDNIDRKILTILQQNARTPLKVIAEQVFLSSPAVSARIERLEAADAVASRTAAASAASTRFFMDFSLLSSVVYRFTSSHVSTFGMANTSSLMPSSSPVCALKSYS